MTQRPTKRKAKYQTWWFTGEETCIFCSQRHAFHTQYICLACDRAVCSCCVMVGEAREVLCPHCAAEEEEK